MSAAITRYQGPRHIGMPLPHRPPKKRRSSWCSEAQDAGNSTHSCFPERPEPCPELSLLQWMLQPPSLPMETAGKVAGTASASLLAPQQVLLEPTAFYPRNGSAGHESHGSGLRPSPCSSGPSFWHLRFSVCLSHSVPSVSRWLIIHQITTVLKVNVMGTGICSKCCSSLYALCSLASHLDCPSAHCQHLATASAHTQVTNDACLATQLEATYVRTPHAKPE
eukprot:3406610-Amphidinium_carterae.1